MPKYHCGSVLIVEPVDATRRFFEAMMLEMGWPFASVASFEEAATAVNHQRPRVVIIKDEARGDSAERPARDFVAGLRRFDSSVKVLCMSATRDYEPDYCPDRIFTQPFDFQSM